MSARRVVVAAILAGCVAGCGQAVDLERERAAVIQTDREWAAAAADKDVERTVSFWTDDAVLFAPDQRPLEGKEAIRRFVADSFALPGFSVSWETTQAVVAAGGDLAYTIGKNRFTAPGPDGDLITATGNGIAIWRKQKDGSWRCVVDVGTNDPTDEEQDAPASAR
jgi:uncharacterized protein (TIGR02246 family)